jgi:hypothetical protein
MKTVKLKEVGFEELDKVVEQTLVVASSRPVKVQLYQMTPTITQYGFDLTGFPKERISLSPNKDTLPALVSCLPFSFSVNWQAIRLVQAGYLLSPVFLILIGLLPFVFLAYMQNKRDNRAKEFNQEIDKYNESIKQYHKTVIPGRYALVVEQEATSVAVDDPYRKPSSEDLSVVFEAEDDGETYGSMMLARLTEIKLQIETVVRKRLDMYPHP